MSLLPASALTSAAAGFSATTPSMAVTAPQAGVPSRDDAIANLASTTGSVNLLAQAAGALGGSGASAGDTSASNGLALTLPPLPQMPPTPPDPTAPTGDNGKSNVVFSDPDADGDLIH